MSTRAVAGTVIGLLLPVPLVVLLLSAGSDPRQRLAPEATFISPVLEFEEKMRLQTYYRNCRDNSECELPLSCLSDTRRRLTLCTDSQCTTDPQCPAGEVCRSVGSVGGGRLVRLCIPVGVRQEGEPCWDTPTTRQTACGPDLLCGGEGWCGRPCAREATQGCPEGFFCADVAPEPLCLPTCADRSCPEGQHCVRHEDGASACAVVYGANCQDDATCTQCDVATFPQAPGETWMECVRRCGGDRPPACPEGSACGMLQCRPTCDAAIPDSCGKGFYCARAYGDRPPVCMPAWMKLKD
ncbi:hypothetical protein [Pyxidicoccus xibeiensis]|uniref:hypothetical protein n=1 Tax=Pyxidicoccus xibeiensis TaxID=2906759 RepID=UPI0020A6FBB0|nr:hypothetical protein [Pyxidicoccus xibeiensis]MCP3145317.1 hypothetical protein [Pyxidicoccus xibeiensis]